MKVSSSIAARTTQLAWMITLATVCLFVAFIIPEQKRDLEFGLQSKAQGIAAALQGEVASAAVTEDYSSVIEHAMQVLAGDPSVEFIVIAKSSGYAVLVDRTGWRILPNLQASWHSGPRVPGGEIGIVPLVGKRLFHYHAPLDCLGIPWGWIHIGLSLNSYDKSVDAVYIRTCFIGIVCICIGLAASALFAKRFVRPILSLRETVDRVAHGDLDARARIHTRDEIEQLAGAFNEMAEAILQRDRIVESVRYAAQTLQSSDEWDAVMDGVVARFGQAARASRALLVEFSSRPDGAVFPMVRLEWCAGDIEPCACLWQGKTAEELGIAARYSLLADGLVVTRHRAELEADGMVCAVPHPLSILAAPVFLADRFWGALALHECREDREWRDVEQHSARAIADMLGASILRQGAQRALVAARDQLEQRVEERTLELRDQMAAKDNALAELQQAQQKLIELSRMSGMAEVATGVLHNVGNVLNSINVSATLISDRVRSSRLAQLRDLSQLLAGHNGHIAEFLAADPRGQRIIPYLGKLSDHLLAERDEIGKESETLVRHVAHVKEVVAMQQGYARNCGLLEKVPAAELMENALRISAPAIERHGIVIARAYEPIGTMVTDRHKVLQILLNLIQNAKDAVKAGGRQPRTVQVRIRSAADSRVSFEVEDNGIGIAPENLARIFSHGFTTKKSGHGFGLHSGALAATELGGALRAFSEGLGSGALFTLELPLQTSIRTDTGGRLEREG